MTPNRWNQVKQLFQQAMELDEESRAGFLAEACGGDENLRREVLLLISGNDQAASFIEAPPHISATEFISERPASFMVGQLIGHCQIVAHLGSGGMGEVYLASDTKLNRKVAIKLLSSQSGTDHLAKKRLVREARAAARLDHPNVCAIHEVVEDNDQAFIVMQYIEGDTLARKIEQQPLEIHEVLDIALQVADALSEAHQHGIIHRDLKPQNIMITPRGQVKVLDFGLAKVIQPASLVDSEAETESLLSQPGAIVGTVPYLSPEQLREKRLDGRSDIFSFGSMVYEMVTGKQAFAADTRAGTLAAILNREPQPLGRYAVSVPPELERIVRKCLEKDRERRYQSARELHIDLQNLRDSLGLPTVPIERPKPRRLTIPRPFVHASLGSALLALVALVLYLVASGRKPIETRIDSLAVLPFANATADPGAEYLSDGITEALINNLSRLPNTRVVARPSAFHYKGRDIEPQTVGHDLKVQAVLTGKVVQLGDSLFISVELADTRDDSHIWGAQYNRKLSDIFSLQAEISKEISEKLRLKLTGEQEKLLTKHYTENAEAYQLYLKGLYYLNKRTEEAFKKATDCFQQAVEKDSNFALGYSGLAQCYALLSNYDLLPAKVGFPRAKAAALKALEIDDTLAEAHTPLGIVKMQYDWDWPGAENELKRAIELDPGYTTARQWYVYYLAVMQRLDESIEESKRAQEIDPLSLNINTNVARALNYARKYDLAIVECQRAIEMDKNFGVAYVSLGLAYEHQAKYMEAIAAFKKAITLFDRSPLSIAALGHAYAISSRRAEALKIIAELKEQSRHRYVSPFHVGAIYNGLGEKDLAFEWFEKAYEDRSSFLVGLRMEPEFDNIRTDPRFKSLLQRIGFPP